MNLAKKTIILTTVLLSVLVNMQLLDGKILLAIFAVLIILILTNKITQFEFIFITMLIPSNIFIFIALSLYIVLYFVNPKTTRSTNSSINNQINVFLIIILLTSILNVIFINANLLNITLQYGIYLVYFIALKIFISNKNRYSLQYFISLLKNSFLYEFMGMCIQYAYFDNWPDSYKGSFISANYFSFFVCLFALYYLVYNNDKKVLKIFYYNAIIFSLYQSDSKHIYIVFLVFSLTYVIMSKIVFLKRNMITKFGLLMLILILSITKISSNMQVSDIVVNKLPVLSQYIYNNQYNFKFRFIDRTINQEMDNYRFFTGFGLGQYASAVANFRAYKEFYHLDDAIFNRSKYLESYILPDYYRNIYLYDQAYVDNLRNTSFVLSYPLVSFISMFAELGFIGYLLLLRIYDALINRDQGSPSFKAIYVFGFLSLSIFDQYFEKPSVYFMLLLFISIQISKSEIREVISNEEV